MLRALYTAGTTLAAPALRLMLVRRVRRGKEIAERLDERRGMDATPRPPGRLIWLHAASVGETVSILPVLSALAEQDADVRVLLTTGTVTSASLLTHRLELGLEERVLHRFVPLDVPVWARRFIEHWRPDAAGFVESEIWPNLLAACRARRVPTMLVNARLSSRSFDRWRKVPGLARDLFGGFDLVQPQSEGDAQRLAALGARASAMTGNLKFAAPPLPAPADELASLRARLAARPMWLAASIHRGEDATIAEVHRALAPRLPGLVTIMAPRHPDRGPEMVGALAGLPVTRRALGEAPPETAGIWIADTMGELGLFYRLAGAVFVGGSLVPHGGQNPLEPARLGCAIAAGPHMTNFAEAACVLEGAGALARVGDAASLTRWVEAMLRDEPRRRAMGAAGMTAADRFADLPGRVAEALLSLARGDR